MTQKCKNLPGIGRVEFIHSNLLDVYCPVAIREGLAVRAYGKFTHLPIVELGGCRVSSEMVNGQTLYTVKLSFKIQDKKEESRSLMYELSAYPLAFRIRDVYKESYLIGINQKPHPGVSSLYSNENSPAGKRCHEVEVTYINIFSLLPLL
jgi:hypothetical protein